MGMSAVAEGADPAGNFDARELGEHEIQEDEVGVEASMAANARRPFSAVDV